MQLLFAANTRCNYIKVIRYSALCTTYKKEYYVPRIKRSQNHYLFIQLVCMYFSLISTLPDAGGRSLGVVDQSRALRGIKGVSVSSSLFSIIDIN